MQTLPLVWKFIQYTYILRLHDKLHIYLVQSLFVYIRIILTATYINLDKR
jgi:hypothetical protein